MTHMFFPHASTSGNREDLSNSVASRDTSQMAVSDVTVFFLLQTLLKARSAELRFQDRHDSGASEMTMEHL